VLGGLLSGTNTYHTDWLTFERGVSNGHEVVWTSGSTQYTNRIATFGELQRGAPQAMGSLPSGYATVAPVSSLPSRSDVASSVSAYLNSQSDTTTAQWLQHELDPRCSPDPTSTTVVVPTPGAHESATSYKDCLATLGLGVNELVAAPWAVDTSRAAREVTVVDRLGESVSPSDTITFVENPETVPAEVPSPSATDDDDQACALPPGAQNTYLTGLDPFAPFLGSYTSTGTADATDPANFETVRGLTFLLNGEITSFSNWAGWGYRHIYAKHGWSAADEAATREVLATDLAPVHQTPPDFGNAVDRWAFIGNDPHDVYWGTTPGGQKVPCLRVVVVEFGPIDMNQVPNQTGIWTSYGKDLTRS
jgi:hypothetical protein